MGEVGRLRVIKGPDQGTIYILKSNSTLIGRGEDADLFLNDLKSSRKHAKIEFTQKGWEVIDQGSANGIFYQGKYLRQILLSSGEHFTIGETIFEFLDGKEHTRVLLSTLRAGAEVAQLDQALASQRLKVKGLSQAAQVASPLEGVKKKPPIVLILAVMGGIYFYMDDIQEFISPKPKQQMVKKEEKPSQSLSSYLPSTVGKEVEKTAEQYYRQGFREFREGNYLRAKAQFELALQVNPSHQLARYYLNGSENEIENRIKQMIGAAQKATVAGRLREAKGYYETSMRLMYYDRSNPNFIECEDAVNKIKNELNRMPAGSGDVK